MCQWKQNLTVSEVRVSHCNKFSTHNALAILKQQRNNLDVTQLLY